jgi:hypothetical protein
MSRDERPVFRTTAWPGGVIEVPPVMLPTGTEIVTVSTYDVVRNRTDVPHIKASCGTTTTIPEELALRVLRQVDCESPDALVDFMNRYGALVDFGYDPHQMLPAQARPIADVVGNAHRLRAIVAHWFAFQNDDDDGIALAWSANGYQEPQSLEEAWDHWTDALNDGLRPIRARVDVVGPERHHGVEPRPVTAYTAMALQIYNDVATETAWKVCESESCRKLFARQEGRAQYGQNRTTGVIYCTKNCARAQAARRSRRNKSATKQRGISHD